MTYESIMKNMLVVFPELTYLKGYMAGKKVLSKLEDACHNLVL